MQGMIAAILWEGWSEGPGQLLSFPVLFHCGSPRAFSYSVLPCRAIQHWLRPRVHQAAGPGPGSGHHESRYPVATQLKKMTPVPLTSSHPSGGVGPCGSSHGYLENTSGHSCVPTAVAALVTLAKEKTWKQPVSAVK